MTSRTRYARCVRCRAPLAHCVRGMTCSGVRQRPTVRDAQPGIIDAALHRSRPVAPVGTGLRSLPATTSVPTARSARASAERRSSPSGTAGIGLDVGPGVRPHSGADLSTGTVDCGTLICPWHGLRSAGDWEFGWTTLPAHDDGVLAWVRLDTVGGEAPLDLPVVPVRPTGGGCTPSPGWSGSASPTTSSPTGSTLGTARGSTPTHSRTLMCSPHHPSTTTSPRTPIVSWWP